MKDEKELSLDEAMQDFARKKLHIESETVSSIKAALDEFGNKQVRPLAVSLSELIKTSEKWFTTGSGSVKVRSVKLERHNNQPKAIVAVDTKQKNSKTVFSQSFYERYGLPKNITEQDFEQAINAEVDNESIRKLSHNSQNMTEAIRIITAHIKRGYISVNGQVFQKASLSGSSKSFLMG